MSTPGRSPRTLFGLDLAEVPQVGILVLTGLCLCLLIVVMSILLLITGWDLLLNVLVVVGYAVILVAAALLVMVIVEGVASRRYFLASLGAVPFLLLLYLASAWEKFAHIGAFFTTGWLSTIF